MMHDVHPGAIDSLLHGDHGAPFDVLGPHRLEKERLSIRVFWPAAESMTVIDCATDTEYPMNKVHDAGIFIVETPILSERYVLEAETPDGQKARFADPYAFGPVLTDYDLYLLHEGRHLESYQKLGAHPMVVDGIEGIHFAVWAPNAHRVSVIGSFNGWDPRVHVMRFHNDSGIWELFIPQARGGDLYRYDIRSRFNNYHVQKTDPYGFFAELRPQNASIVADLSRYTWGDGEWMAAREQQRVLDRPVAIYEVHLGSWRRNDDGTWLSYRDLAPQLVEYAQQMGYTHLELMPVAEHPLDASWGYQITGYFAPTSRYGTPDDFRFLVDYCHQHGIGVILDWVPAHFPKDGHALSYFDGTHLYEHADPRQAEHPDWGTYIFNYGRNEVRNFLLSNALFWLKEYHIDALRVDAVSSMLYLDFSRKAGEWIPNQYGGNENLEAVTFLKEFNEVVHRECPGTFTVAEESTAWPMVSRPTYLGGLGFTLKWNMGWMHDTLRYVSKDPMYRRYEHHNITFSLFYAFSENFVLALSHDEVVHGKGSLIAKIPGDHWQQSATLRTVYGYQYTHPGKKLLFMGQEFGQWREWNENWGLDWNLLDFPLHTQLQEWVRDLNHLYRTEPALYELDFDARGFQWIEANDAEQSVYSYIRFANDSSDFLVVVANFTPLPRTNYRIGVPEAGTYVELLNSDSSRYGGGDVGNGGQAVTETVTWHSWSQSLNLTLPPLGILILKPVRA